YRGDDGELIDASLDRLDPAVVVSGGPVRRFRSVKGQRHYSGWYWSATMGRHVVYEPLLELSRWCRPRGGVPGRTPPARLPAPRCLPRQRWPVAAWMTSQ
ncbi:MAG: hypothetical protein WCF04_06260, partial [Candidatus Nanopelagicales bacterium]